VARIPSFSKIIGQEEFSIAQRTPKHFQRYSLGTGGWLL
jgi:hypothetical protein